MEYSYFVKVVFVDGKSIEFYSGSSFDSTAEGRIILWENAKVDGEYLEYYAVSVGTIKDIRERYLEGK
jgi:hypothetical protein